MKLLLVEDETKAADYLKLGFKQNGFVVDHADNGVDAVFTLKNKAMK